MRTLKSGEAPQGSPGGEELLSLYEEAHGAGEADLDARALSEWMEWELAALEAGLDPDLSREELERRILRQRPRGEKGGAA